MAFSSSSWYKNSDKAISDQAWQVKRGDDFKIDLTYLMSKPSLQRPTKIEIKFSDVFPPNDSGLGKRRSVARKA